MNLDLTKGKLLADKLLVIEEKGADAEQVTAGGIIIPNDSESTDKASVAKVLAVSTRIRDCEVEEDKVYVGDRLLFSKYAGTVATYEGIEYRILRITDVIMVLPEVVKSE